MATSPSEFRIFRTPHFSHPTITKECEDLVGAEFGAGLHVLVCTETNREKLGKSNNR